MWGFALLAAMTVGFTVLFDRAMRRPWIAALASIFCAPLAYQVLGYLAVGYLDPFFLIALVYSFMICLPIAGLTALVRVWVHSRAGSHG